MVDDEMRRRMELIAPHVGRAVRTGKVISLRQAEAATFADILDGLSPAIFLVDIDGQIIHANAASHLLLEKGDFLRSVNGRLTATDTQADRALRDAFVASGSHARLAARATPCQFQTVPAVIAIWLMYCP